MSFSRAPVKRFNENIGCAPAPGTYELKPGEVKGPASFHRSERFKQPKASAPGFPTPSPSKDVPMSPVRRTLSVDGLVEGSVSKKDKSGLSMQMKQQKLLEKEIRSLVHQRGEQDKRLVALEEELRKVEYKLLSAVREKTGLAANVTTLERQLAELKKTNEFLKNKVSADATKKKIQSLSMELMDARNKLDAKEKMLSFLQISMEGQVKLLEVDMEAARATLTALRERNMDLEDLHRDTKVQNEELEKEMDTLQAVIQELREEIRVLQGYLDTANDHNQDLRIKLRDHLEQKLEQCTTDLCTSQASLRLKEEESEKRQQDLMSSQDALRETEKLLQRIEAELTSSMKAMGEMEMQMQRTNQELSASQSAVCQQESELARLRELLKRTEEELDKKVAHLGERCKVLEEERDRSQENGKKRIEELTAELSLLQETRKSEEVMQEQLQQAHTSLERAATLASVLDQVKEETEKERRQLEDELEEALGELSVLELQEERREDEEKSRQEILRSLQQEKTNMERELTETRALLNGMLLEVQTCLAQRDEEMKRAEEEEAQRLLKQAGEEKEEILRLLDQEKGEREAQRRESLQVMSEEVGRLESQLKKAAEEKLALQCLVGEMEEEKLCLQNKLKAKDDSLLVQLDSNSACLENQMRELEEERNSLKTQAATAVDAVDVATEHWRRQYEELYAKVKPFQEQLNGFAAERDALLNENGANQEELTRLADAYARLLGHQNQKQKIRHVVKLKDENVALKQELSKLRAQVSRQKKDVEQLKAGQRKFDPSKAFNHQDSKENQNPAASTLRQGKLHTHTRSYFSKYLIGDVSEIQTELIFNSQALSVIHFCLDVSL
uniref:Hyaluronan-mediated motility receptor C-terminal domain-containing protein n=1 Tax=Esox lucius TaxID=8010 RepID=A0A6Q2XFH3_ESOLU